jgi:hypothetical protein
VSDIVGCVSGVQVKVMAGRELGFHYIETNNINCSNDICVYVYVIFAGSGIGRKILEA